jgi:hypothetical protein
MSAKVGMVILSQEGTASCSARVTSRLWKIADIIDVLETWRQHTMANDLFVHHEVSGGAARSGPFKYLNEAIQKACALLRTHGPTAIVSIHDNEHVIMGCNEVRKRCEAEQ